MGHHGIHGRQFQFYQFQNHTFKCIVCIYCIKKKSQESRFSENDDFFVKFVSPKTLEILFRKNEIQASSQLRMDSVLPTKGTVVSWAPNFTNLTQCGKAKSVPILVPLTFSWLENHYFFTQPGWCLSLMKTLGQFLLSSVYRHYHYF